ncbi:MAG: HAMP domain-containing histidine kinase [Elusimicrobia bacterium]|nr:HAMP domain-containing histidine kinase [Elusimicrobiota bacterium]
MILLPFALEMLAFAWVLRGIVAEVIENQANVRTQMGTSVVELAAAQGNLDLLSHVRWLWDDPDTVNYAYVVDARGTIRRHSDPRFNDRPVSEWDAAGLASQALDVERPVFSGADKIAAVHIGFSKAHHEKALRRAWERFLNPMLAAALLGLGLSLVLGVGLAAYMAARIRDLVQGTQAVAGGDLSVEVPETSSNELGDLARQFNVMARRLKVIDELKDEFIANVSHDLRNPLAAIQSFADVLQGGMYGPVNERQMGALEIMRGSAKRLHEMVENVLDMAKVKAGRLEVEKKPFDLNELLARSVSLFEVSAREKGVELSRDLPPASFRALGDPQAVERVVSNLLGNALKFTPKGGRIELRAGPEGDWLRVSVKDTGYGIPAKDLPRLFRRFERLDVEGQRDRKIAGAGLGLAASRSLVEAHGGKIWAESEEGKGTTFFFTLPREKA